MGFGRPTTLYKYKNVTGIGIDHVEDMLRNNRVRFSSPLDFNDPFDCRCIFDISNTREEIVFRKAAFLTKSSRASLNDALAEADREVPVEPAEVDRWQMQQIDGHSRRAANTGIFCLTRDMHNFIMWTHYARNHTGICIQFRVRDVSAKGHIDFIGDAQPVEYADRCPKINHVRDASVDIIRKAFLTKATPFRHELEWRIVHYDQGAGLKPIPRGIIGAVVLGCNMDPAIEERLIRACAEYDGDVDIVRAKLDPETFGLAVEREQTV